MQQLADGTVVGGFVRSSANTDLFGSRCIGHVVQLAIEDFMKAVTQVGLVESKQAMWDYDPKAAENRVLSGGLDVIAAIRTLSIKVRLALCLERRLPLYLPAGFSDPSISPAQGGLPANPKAVRHRETTCHSPLYGDTLGQCPEDAEALSPLERGTLSLISGLSWVTHILSTAYHFVHGDRGCQIWSHHDDTPKRQGYQEDSVVGIPA